MSKPTKVADEYLEAMKGKEKIFKKSFLKLIKLNKKLSLIKCPNIFFRFFNVSFKLKQKFKQYLCKQATCYFLQKKIIF